MITQAADPRAEGPDSCQGWRRARRQHLSGGWLGQGVPRKRGSLVQMQHITARRLDVLGYSNHMHGLNVDYFTCVPS